MLNAHKRIAIVGAGLSGATLAYELSAKGYKDITVFEQRDHIAGNIHTEREPRTNIMMHVYGPHIFHTDDEKVWNWMRQFTEMVPHIQRTKGIGCDGKVYSLPINLHTINQYLGENFTPEDAKRYLASVTDRFVRRGQPRNFEEYALSTMGPSLYEAFIRGYTEKQWGIHPSELPATILKRLPFRLDYNDNAFFHRFQGIPRNGYTYAVKNMLDCPGVTVRLGTKFDPDSNGARQFDYVFNTGPLDEWFFYGRGSLRYRTLDLQTTVRMSVQDAQGCAVMNNCDPTSKWTRRTEHKHFTPWEPHTGTVVTQEVPRNWRPGDIHFYPMRLAADKEKLAAYEEMASKDNKTMHVGRLATYRYLDMDQCISEAMWAADVFHRKAQGWAPIDRPGQEVFR